MAYEKLSKTIELIERDIKILKTLKSITGNQSWSYAECAALLGVPSTTVEKVVEENCLRYPPKDKNALDSTSIEEPVLTDKGWVTPSLPEHIKPRRRIVFCNKPSDLTAPLKKLEKKRMMFLDDALKVLKEMGLIHDGPSN